jgi:acyl-CoA synthetase (AMP-forming)/AMP-acid ligase II
VGRTDDMFVCGGENLYPGEIERLLETHPGVAQAAVIPVADEIKGQIPAAFIVRKPGATVTEDEVKAHALANGPVYQHPRFVRFIDEMPLSAANKIDKKRIRDMATDLGR